MYLVGSTSGTTNVWAKSHFQSNGLNHFSNMHGSANDFWITVGYTGVEPWKALLDRDGNIRKYGGSGNFEPLIKECLGTS